MMNATEEQGVEQIQTFVEMRDGVKLNTFVFLPKGRGPQFPVILQRTPYGITSPQGEALHDPAHGWLPEVGEEMHGSILRGWKAIVQRGYAAVYQDTRGRYGSEGVDRVYADDAADGYDTLEWIAKQPWSNQKVGMSGSSAGATTTFAAASARHPTLKAFFAQVGGASIYDDIVYEGGSIEMERLWLWVARNIPGLSKSHKQAMIKRFGITEDALDTAAKGAATRYERLDAACRSDPPFIGSDDWMRLPLTGYPDFSTWQPFLDEILTHPVPDDFRRQHDFRGKIDIPGFHVTNWFDIFLHSMIAAFTDIQARVGNQRLWIGPNDHYFVYETNFWPRDPYFEWFDHWLKGEPTDIMNEASVYYAPNAWVEDPAGYVADDWRHAEQWPPANVAMQRLYLSVNGGLTAEMLDDTHEGVRDFTYDPHHPIPTYGGRNMLIDAGSRDQRQAQALPDYGLMYRGEPLTEGLTIAGPVRVTLYVGSDCPDTDFVAKLIEVMPDGRTMLMMDGVVRAMYRDALALEPQHLEPGETYRLNIELADIHHTFLIGSSIQVDINSSNFPRRARNTNSGNPVLANDSDADIRVAVNTVYHAGVTPSFIELPVLDR